MRNSKAWIATPVLSIMALAVTLLCMPGLAQASAADGSVATLKVGSQQVVFAPVADSSGLVLTVSGPNGYYFSEEFEKGAAPAFSALNEGSRLADGLYTYEIKARPVLDGKARELIAAARERGNREAIDELRGRGVLPKRPLVQSGNLMVVNGTFIVPAAAEDAAKDIVHNDDVIIDGSLCVGNDCYSGLAFGFDTTVMMENNLRIFFDDTSTIQNYPRNDWRIICNDSTDGGGRYFAIEDATEVSNILVLEAGAPDNSIYVDSYGDVGINTSTPYYELHIVDGDSPAVRLDQDGSYGWTPQKWDLCGNESNFFIRDATHASKLPFRIEPDAPTDSIFIKSNGYVGLGTGSPAKALEIEAAGPAFRLRNSSGGVWDFKVNSSTQRLNITDDSAGTRVPVKIDPGSDNNLFRIGVNASDRIDITGRLFINGSQVTPDYVFDPGYPLESIEEHAAKMWGGGHLPAVSPATVGPDGRYPIDVGARSQGMLEELEKAHIYIEQLHRTLSEVIETSQQKDTKISSLENRTEELEQRLAELEARLR